MNQSMSHLFAQVPRADIQRSVFDRSHTLKTAFNSGYLVPIFVDEVLPGDTFNLDLSLFGRLSTMAVPVMDNLYLETFFFAVPNRLVWDHWQQFCGEQKNPGDSTDYLIPRLAYPSGGTYQPGTIHDYFGIPTNTTGNGLVISALWHRAYNLIWNEWFRDENLQDSLTVPTDDGPDPQNIYALRKRGKRHDYFTSCLPWPQKGPGVSINLAGNAPVYGDGLSVALSTAPVYRSLTHLHLKTMGVRNSDYSGGDLGDYPPLLSGNAGTTGYNHTVAQGGGRYTDVGIPTKEELGNVSSGLTADLSAASAVTINDLRTAFQIQRMYEVLARGGSRYTELLRSFFGVISPDARLQRPEYLGGTSCRIIVHPVSQQSASTDVTPQGNLAAFATMGDVQHVFTKSFVEHCVVIGLACVRADLTYQQGLNRMFSRRTRFDYYWPTLAHLGEQAVLNKEIYSIGDEQLGASSQDNAVFGYQERWAEYRYKPSMITGKLRSTASDSLDVWHLAQKFDSLPALNSDFIEENVPLDRVLAVNGDQPQIILDADFSLHCARPMPVYSVPGLIDHF